MKKIMKKCLELSIKKWEKVMAHKPIPMVWVPRIGKTDIEFKRVMSEFKAGKCGIMYIDSERGN